MPLTTAALSVRPALQQALAPQEQTKPLSPVTWDWHWKRSPGDTPAEVAKLREMRQGAIDFLSEIAAGAPPRWLTLCGRPGCGKTHLADRIRWWLHAHGENPYKNTTKLPPSDYTSAYCYAQEASLFAKWGRLLEAARDGNFHPLRYAGRDHYKIIDDLGVDSFDRDALPSPFAAQKMAELLDRRLGKWTVLATNFTPADLARLFDPRISSRLLRAGNILIDCTPLRDFHLRR